LNPTGPYSGLFFHCIYPKGRYSGLSIYRHNPTGLYSGQNVLWWNSSCGALQWLLYGSVSIHLHSASCSAHQSEALPVTRS